MTHAPLYIVIVPSLLLLFTSAPAAQVQHAPRQSCLASSPGTTAHSEPDATRDWITDFIGLQQIRRQTAPGTIRLSINDVVVQEVDENGFWISAHDTACHLYVRPAEGDLIRVRRGELVSVQGEIRYGAQRATSSGKPRQQPYLYSYIVRPAWYADPQRAAAAEK